MAECLSVGVLVADHICAPIDHMPVPGECILTDRLQLAIGGCASNAAMDMARVGIDVSVVGCVGDDAFGRFIIETLEGRGVGTALIRPLSDVGTSASLIINVRDQDRRFVHSVGANARLRAADIPWEEVRRAKVLYVGGMLLASGLLGRELAEVFAEARRAGVVTVLDVVVPAPGDHWAQLEPLLPHTDVFLPNDDEGRAILGIDDPRRQAERYAAAGAKTVVVTCGAKGLGCSRPNSACTRASFRSSSSAAPGRATRSTPATSPACSPASALASAWPGEAYWGRAASGRSAPPKASSRVTRPRPSFASTN
jgi:sugar/nucleoside kinase (ribokinase family)